MSLWRFLFGYDDPDEPTTPMPSGPEVNPATGLPMIDDIGSIDVAGNPYGVDLHSGDFSGPEIGGCDSDWL